MRELTKNVEIEGARYQLSKMTAMAASRIKNLLLAAAVSSPMAKAAAEQRGAAEQAVAPTPENADGAVVVMWITAGQVLDEGVYSQIQTICLKTVAECVEGSEAAIPIMMADGRWANKDLERNPTAVDSLIIEALKFNIAPFFSGAALKLAAQPR